MRGMPEIQVLATAEEAAQAAAIVVLDAARKSVQAQGRFILALAGGSTPALLYRTLSRPPYRDDVPWAQTHVFWGDERWVAPDDEASNGLLAHRELLSRVAVPAENIRTIVTQGITPEGAAALAEQEFRALFQGDQEPQLDLILLGLGQDGHTASLFPGSPAIGERDALFTANHLADGTVRITATITLINEARQAIFLVTGEHKARALRQVLNPEPDTRVSPASMVRAGDGDVTWIVDEAAASLLPEEED